MKYAVAGLFLIVLLSSALFADSETTTKTRNQELGAKGVVGRNVLAPRLGTEGDTAAEVAKLQGQPAAEQSAPSATSKDQDKSNKETDASTHDATNSKPRVLKIGVTQITSSTDESLSVEGLQQELVSDINFLGGKAVILAADPNDRDAANEQAKQQACDYIIFTQITNFKTASVGQKLGSVLSNKGGLGGVGGNGRGRIEISANVKIFQPDVFTPALDGSSDFRGNDIDNTVKGLMRTEARTVMLELRKLESKK